MTAAQSFLTCELCHGHGYEQTEDGKEECRACNSKPADGEGLRECAEGKTGVAEYPECQIAKGK